MWLIHECLQVINKPAGNAVCLHLFAGFIITGGITVEYFQIIAVNLAFFIDVLMSRNLFPSSIPLSIIY